MLRVMILGGVLLLLLAPGWTLSSEPKPAKGTTLEDDLKKLEGKWISADKQPLQWAVTFQLEGDGEKSRGKDAAWILEQARREI